MGGKGKRRREKNYLAAHGGTARLPPPPDASKLDALPSKLRKLMFFTAASANDSAKASNAGEEKKSGDADKKIRTVNSAEISSETETTNDVAENDAERKSKKKRKRKQVKDLRFENDMKLEGHSRRRERKKKYWEAKKMKQKKAKSEESMDFPGCENVKFGDVVEAPPKLVVVPKALKTIQNVSRERLRLQAIDAYRNRKGWTSRPGLQFPPETA